MTIIPYFQAKYQEFARGLPVLAVAIPCISSERQDRLHGIFHQDLGQELLHNHLGGHVTYVLGVKTTKGPGWGASGSVLLVEVT